MYFTFNNSFMKPTKDKKANKESTKVEVITPIKSEKRKSNKKEVETKSQSETELLEEFIEVVKDPSNQVKIKKEEVISDSTSTIESEISTEKVKEDIDFIERLTGQVWKSDKSTVRVLVTLVIVLCILVWVLLWSAFTRILRINHLEDTISTASWVIEVVDRENRMLRDQNYFLQLKSWATELVPMMTR